jgi:hypothetical protein
MHYVTYMTHTVIKTLCHLFPFYFFQSGLIYYIHDLHFCCHIYFFCIQAEALGFSFLIKEYTFRLDS